VLMLVRDSTALRSGSIAEKVDLAMSDLSLRHLLGYQHQGTCTRSHVTLRIVQMKRVLL